MKYTRRRHLRSIMLRDAPTDSGEANPQGGGGAPAATNPPAPAAPPTPPSNTPPAEFDPSSLSPEAKRYLDAQIKAADEKARTGTRDNAAKAARDQVLKTLAEALGQKPAEVDPAKVAQDLAAERAENARLRSQLAIGTACRKPEIGADEDLVMAYLSSKGQLAGLDPADKGYAAAVEKLVTEAVAAKPALKLATTPPTPPGGRVPPAAGAFNRPAGGEGGERLDLHQALTQHYAGQRQQ